MSANPIQGGSHCTPQIRPMALGAEAVESDMTMRCLVRRIPPIGAVGGGRPCAALRDRRGDCYELNCYCQYGSETQREYEAGSDRH